MSIQQDTRKQPETPPLPDADQPRDWYFTFRAGTRLYAAAGAEPIGLGHGVDLRGYYVFIHGTFHTARAWMYDTFGGAWSAQLTKLPPIDDLPGQVTWKELLKITETGTESRLS